MTGHFSLWICAIFGLLCITPDIFFQNFKQIIHFDGTSGWYEHTWKWFGTSKLLLYILCSAWNNSLTQTNLYCNTKIDPLCSAILATVFNSELHCKTKSKVTFWCKQKHGSRLMWLAFEFNYNATLNYYGNQSKNQRGRKTEHHIRALKSLRQLCMAIPHDI